MLTRASRLSPHVQEYILTSFCDDNTAVKTTIDIGRLFYKRKPDEWKSDPTGKYIASWHESFHKTVMRHYRHYRDTIAAHQLAQYPKLSGEVEINLTYFGGRRAKKDDERAIKKLLGIKIGRPIAYRKLRGKKPKKTFERPVLGLLQRGGTLVLLPVESRARAFLELMIRQIVVKGSVIYTDKEKGLAAIKTLGYIHRAVNHSKHHVDKNGWHINGIESAFHKVKEGLHKNSRGIPKSTIDLHLKEREFRYNNRRSVEDALRALL